MVNIIMANVGTVVCFRTGNPQNERMLLPLFSPFIDQGEIANLPAFNFYAKLSAIHAQEPLSGQTLLLEDDGSSEIMRTAIDHSRRVFATRQAEVQLKDNPGTKTSKKDIKAPRIKKTKSKRNTKPSTNKIVRTSSVPSSSRPPGF